MKIALATMMILSALPVSAGGHYQRYRSYSGIYRPEVQHAYESQRGYAREEKCYKNEYREEYVPGTSNSPGYVKSYKERVQVPCNSRVYRRDDATPTPQLPQSPNADENSCIEGSILGGIAGGGLGAVLSRGDGRWWAIPTGIVGGALVGCQIDGG